MKRIAIVNRGEAAGRCIRAIRELRIQEGSELSSIALYTEPDRSAPFVRQADLALSLGPALRATRAGRQVPAYLDHARVLAALRATRADAVWPGWGFVAEDPNFVAALEERDITFLGPPSAVIRALGDKIAGKQLAEEAGVSVAPWSGGPVGDDAHATADRLGYPLMVKASAGGGGRGIRRVANRDALVDALSSARAEAAHAFGDDALFLETFVDQPRHIEVQIAADTHGNVVSFGLRDCSVQRRHQKVLEESPPPNIDQGVAAAIEDAAIRLATKAGYRGVGTVEFLLDRDGKGFYFLEVNPRLQVEHGVSESVFGCDLVALQIRIARGETIAPSAPPRGHAIEARICAEDPQREFAPAPGEIALLDLPIGPGIRSDSSAAAGTTVPAEFDSMVAKLIAWAPTRKEAVARLRAALGDLRLVIDGGASNKGFLLNLLDDREVRDGGVDIGWLDRNLPRLTVSRHAPQALLVAAILTYLRERAIQRLNFYGEVARGEPQSIPATDGQTVDLSYGADAYAVRVLALGDWRYRADLDGQTCVAELLDREEWACQLAIGEDRYSVEYAEGPSSIQIEVNGHRHTIGRDHGGEVRATAPSVVVAIDVAVGDRVTAGQRIAVLEAMKIEIGLSAPVSGTVQEIRCSNSQRVAAGDILMVIQAEDEAGEEATLRISLPREETETDPAPTENEINYGEAFDEDRFRRERVRRATSNLLRRIMLGYDSEAEEMSGLVEFLDSPLPDDPDEVVIRELGELRAAIALFADLEVLFSRQLHSAAGGATGRSNDALLRSYTRRIEGEGAALDDHFVNLLKAALAHYEIDSLRPTEQLQRALFRIYAARKQRTARYRVIEALLRHFGRLAQAGLQVADATLADALGTCIVLRGDVPDGLADAASELRAGLFEAPEVARRTQLASRVLDSTLAEIEGATDAPNRAAIVASLADGAAPIFAAIAAGVERGDRGYALLASEALALRMHSPAAIVRRETVAGSPDVARLGIESDGDTRTLTAATIRWRDLDSAWPTICESAEADSTIELFTVADEELGTDVLRAQLERMLENTRPTNSPVVLSQFGPGVAETSVGVDANGSWTETSALHPATHRRLGFDRLSAFELQRLPAPAPLVAMFGKAKERPNDQRLFVYGEVHAAVPGFSGTLHEASFVRVFAEAVRTLRRLRNDNTDWRGLHWNRIVLRVRPSFILAEDNLQRLMDELLPSTRHLGLDRILVQMSLRDGDDDSSVVERELVIEPMGDSGSPRTMWRDPHHAPLEVADRRARRLASARRRGWIDPYDAIRIFCGGDYAGDTFSEYDLDEDGRTATPVHGREPGNAEAGVVFGISTAHTQKHPEGMRRVAILSDPTRGLGALTAAETKRVIAALDLAAAEALPVEWFTNSSGARIAMDSGTENLDSVATVVRRIVHFTQDGGEINIVVIGANVGAQSYFDALSTMLMHTRGILVMTRPASMVLTGKRALDASGSVSADDERGIGGFEEIMGPNGQAQYYAPTLEAAYAILLRHYEVTYVAPGEKRPRRHITEDPARRNIATAGCQAEDWPGAPPGATIGDYLGEETNPGRKRPFSIRPVMRALIDIDGGNLERWAAMRGAETAVVWDAHLGGHPVCLIGVDNRALPRDGYAPPDGPSEWTGATLFPRSSKKVARAINAASSNRAVVILANLAGFDGSPESMRELQLEYGAEIARAVVNFDGPILFVVTSRYHGGAYVVFSTKLNDQLRAFALRGSFASVIGGGPAATVIFASEVRKRTEADPRVVKILEQIERTSHRLTKASLRSQLDSIRQEVSAEHRAAIAAEFDEIHSVERAREVGSLHEIIDVEDLRARLIEYLNDVPRP